MQIFPKRVVETLEKWAPPRQATFKSPLGNKRQKSLNENQVLP